MKIVEKIKKYFYNREQEKKEYEESLKRQEELIKIIEDLKEIKIFSEKENKNQKIIKKLENKTKNNNKNFENQFDKIIHIDLKNKPNKKINIIDLIDIEKMNIGQLQNTYKCVKKSIEQATKKNNQIEIQKLINLKKKIKQIMISRNETFDLEYIKCNLKFGNFENLNLYEYYLNDLYKNTNSRKDKIEILTVMKLISKIKNQKNKQYIKKIG